MAQGVKILYVEHLTTSEFSMQLDKSPGHEGLLLAFVSFVKEETFCQALLFAKCLETDTKSVRLFTELIDFRMLKLYP